MITIDELTATGQMKRDLDAMNPLRNTYASAVATAIGNGFPNFEYMNNASAFASSSAIQQSIESMRIFDMHRDSLAMITATGRAGSDYWQRPATFQMPESLQRTMESLNITNAIKDAMALQRITGNSSLENIQKMLGATSLLSIQKVIEPLAGISELRDSFAEKAAAGFGAFETIRKSMDAFAATSIAQQASLSMMGINSIQESLGFRVSTIQNALKTMQHSKLFSDTESITNAIGSFSASQAFRDSIIALNQEGVFQQAMAYYNSANYSLPDEFDMDEVDVTSTLTQLESMNNGNFLEFFRKLPPTMQTIIIFCFMQTIWPIFINVFSGLITPQIERMIKSDKLSTDQIRAIKKLPATNEIDTENFRFVTRNNVRLRAKPSTKSEVLDELVTGQVIKVLGKKKNWAEVVYRYEDGQAFHGWILTTYTARFNISGSMQGR